MPLSRLQINHVRNLHAVALRELQQINVFHGPNGSGKTSLLEAIHLLGMARSFRGNSARTLITHGQRHCVVFGTVVGGTGGTLPLGVQRGVGGDAQLKVGGRTVRSVAALLEHLPVQVINADSFDLLSGAPAARRRFLDWGVFHVEQRFYGSWQRFQRCIKQRNNLLRHGKIHDRELSVWTRDLAATGAVISEFRQAYVQQLAPCFQAMMRRLAPGLEDLELRFRRGWDRQLSYEEALEQSLASDLEQGYTHVGPQRADLRLFVGGHLAADTLSRGQQKLVICGLKLAQGQLLAEVPEAVRCIYLVDDLPSELDREHARRVCAVLADMGAQVFITCVERDAIVDVWPREASSVPVMFHVEQGRVEPDGPG